MLCLQSVPHLFRLPGIWDGAAVLDGWNRGCGEKFMYMCENRMASDA